METESLSGGVSAFCPVGSAVMAEARNIFKINKKTLMLTRVGLTIPFAAVILE